MSPRRLPAAASSSSPSSSSLWDPRRCSDRFFSSLRSVEDRLASEDGYSGRSAPSRAFCPPHQTTRSSDRSSSRSSPPSPSLSYSGPLFLDGHRGRLAHPHLVCSAGAVQAESSDLPPLELLSESILGKSPPSAPVASSNPRSPGEVVDGELESNVERLMALLHLTGFEQGGGEGVWSDSGDDEESGGLLSRIAGVKGPKCRKDVERLDEWIRHYRSRRPSAGDGGGAKAKREPARVAHLLLARAAWAGRGTDGARCLEGMGFPETVEDYFRHDPPGRSS